MLRTDDRIMQTIKGVKTAMSSFKRIGFIVLDSVGIGEAPDAADFGDTGSHTLGHILERVPGLKLPNLQQLGLANIAPLPPLEPVTAPTGYYGKMQEVSVGKDTMTGHWELMGLKIEVPFNTYFDGFPAELIEVRSGYRTQGHRQQAGFRHRDSRGIRRGADEDGRMDCLYFGGQRVPACSA